MSCYTVCIQNMQLAIKNLLLHRCTICVVHKTVILPKLVDGAIKLGLIKKSKNVRDKRIYMLALTKEGTRRVENELEKYFLELSNLCEEISTAST